MVGIAAGVLTVAALLVIVVYELERIACALERTSQPVGKPGDGKEPK